MTDAPFTRRLTGPVAVLALGFTAVSLSARAQSPDLETDIRTFLIEESVASIMVEACADAGIVAAGDVRQRAERMVHALIDAGYPPNDVLNMLEAQKIAIARDEAVIEYLEWNGIGPGDGDRICSWAETEIAAQSALGRRLGYE